MARYGEVWARAREKELPPELVVSPLAKRPYDLRHAAVSWWLSSGVDPQTVAKRADHSVAVLFRVYAKFINDSDDVTKREDLSAAGVSGPMAGPRLSHKCPTRTGQEAGFGQTKWDIRHN